MNKIAKTIIILLILAIVGVAIYLYLNQDKFNDLKNTESENSRKIEGTKTKVTDIDAVNTVDWKTYTNEKYGYTIQYPQDWIVGEERSVVDGVNNIPSIVNISDKNSEYKIILEVNKKEDLKNREALDKRNVLIDGQNYTVYVFPNGYECHGDGERDCSYLQIPIQYNGFWYKLQAIKKLKSYEKTYLDILSTFKFTK